MTSRSQWLVLLGVLVAVYGLQGEINGGVLSSVQSTKVLGQGNVSVSASTLANASVMPLVSIERGETQEVQESSVQGIDETLFYSATAAQAKTEPVEPIIVKPAVNVSAELTAAVKLEAVLTGGAVINARFYAKGDVVATVKDGDGEPTSAKLIYIGADHVIVGADGVTQKVSL